MEEYILDLYLPQILSKQMETTSIVTLFTKFIDNISVMILQLILPITIGERIKHLMFLLFYMTIMMILAWVL